MAVFKIQYFRAGVHYKCTLFAAKQPNMTWANCGSFALTLEEFKDAELAMSGVMFQEIKGHA